MDPSFKEREREGGWGGGDRSKKKDRKERAEDPSFHTSPSKKGWSLEKGVEGQTQGTWKPDPEGYQRLEEPSAPLASRAIFSPQVLLSG